MKLGVWVQHLFHTVSLSHKKMLASLSFSVFGETSGDLCYVSTVSVEMDPDLSVGPWLMCKKMVNSPASSFFFLISIVANSSFRNNTLDIASKLAGRFNCS